MDEVPQTTVRFRVGDVVHPRPVQVLTDLFRHLNLQGEVVAVTTDGDRPYLVVRVVGLPEALIVPLERVAPTFDHDGAAMGAMV